MNDQCSSIFSYFSIFDLIVLIYWNSGMKGQSYRQNAQNRFTEQQDEGLDHLTRLVDNKLYYLNRSFENNLKIHELYLDLLKSKKCLHAKDLKQYYRIFTNSKAEAVMFNNQMQKQKQDDQIHQNSQQMLITIKRMYCRLIQKMMVKISYYLMNKHSLSFCNNIINELMKKCDVIIRRLNNLKDMSCMNEIILKVFQENEQFQEFIFTQLIHKGYINSVDEFYRINGIDLNHQEIFQRNKEDDEENQQIQQQHQQVHLHPRVKRNARYISNLGKDLAQPDMKKQLKSISKLQQNRVGNQEIQIKYRQLLLNIDRIISSESQFQQIVQAKENQQRDQGSNLPGDINNPSLLFNSQIVEKQGQNDQTEEKKSQTYGLTKKKTLKIMKKQSYKKQNEKSIKSLQLKGELHQKQITIDSFRSNTNVSQPTWRAQNQRKSTALSSRFFSKSFLNAIKTLQKTGLNDHSNQLSIKRMSQHIIRFHKQSENRESMDNHSGYKDKTSTSTMLKKNKEKISIIKLLNIYKNRTIEQFVNVTRKNFQQSQGKISERVAQLNKSKFLNQKIELKQEYQLENLIPVNCYDNLKRIKRAKNKGLVKISNFRQQTQNKLMHLSYLRGHLQNSHPLNKSYQKLKMIDNLETNRHPQIFNSQSLNFQNFRINQRYSQVRQKNTNDLATIKSSPDKKSLQNSIMTPKGIENMDISRVKYDFIQKKSKTTQTTAIQTPRLPYFEVYDRSRRMIIK